MRFAFFNIIFIISLTCLFALQGVWLYYAYKNETVKIQGILNKTLLKSIEEETNSRFAFIEEDDKIVENSHDRMYEYEYDENKGNLVSQQFDFIQQVLLLEGVFFDLTKVDSIYSASLYKENIHVKYCLNYTDSLGNSIESCGENIDKGFNTIIIPIVNGTKVEAIAKITTPAIFHSMLEILFVSIPIFFFIITCMIYQIKTFITQHQLHQLRKDLVHTLSHDMKTPLATIYSVLVQLNNGYLDAHPKTKNKFKIIAIEQALNLQYIVNQILTAAYIDRKQLTLNKQEFDLPEMINSLIDKFTVRSDKVIEFSQKYDLNKKPIYADPFYLENAISNLIDNAIKYSGNAVKIDIECVTEDKHVYIRIKDNGFGISKKDQQKMFNRFERSAEVKRKRICGFGLGLNHVKHIIEAHKGSIALVSQKGVGSEFTVSIPLFIKC